MYISEENIQGRQDQAYADIKYDQAADRIRQEDELPGKMNAVDHTENKENAECQSEINQALDIFGEEEKIFWHTDLRKYLGVIQKGTHALSGRFTKKGENKVAAEQIRRVVRRRPPEKISENQLHDQHKKKRVQDAPKHSEYCAFVFLFKITLDQLLEEEAV